MITMYEYCVGTDLMEHYLPHQTLVPAVSHPSGVSLVELVGWYAIVV